MNSSEPWLIKNSTKEERQKRVNGAMAIQLTAGPAPSEKAMKFFQKYIDGEMEIEEIKNILIEMYTKVE